MGLNPTDVKVSDKEKEGRKEWNGRNAKKERKERKENDGRKGKNKKIMPIGLNV